jgi:hypothetical protein
MSTLGSYIVFMRAARSKLRAAAELKVTNVIQSVVIGSSRLSLKERGRSDTDII